jgi:hypothetical protein
VIGEKVLHPQKQDRTAFTSPVGREITCEAPFTNCDRETDYATAWRKLSEKGPSPES